MFSKFGYLLKSRKFWAAVIALIGVIAAYATNEITSWQMIQAIVALAASYSAGVAIEDAGYGIGRSASQE